MFDGARAQSVLAQSSGQSETCLAAAGVRAGGLLVHAMLEWLEIRPQPLSL